jgi:hypothetical protein
LKVIVTREKTNKNFLPKNWHSLAMSARGGGVEAGKSDKLKQGLK